ncbi:hypothetical protein ACNKU7_04635 [Microbulbifer sp. SA54]|uniref:hypothetical protein n=1 Tax=Microbulbifer sp. SA54 TaxID=3401577 RepID=UPI003AAE7598
MTALSHLHHKIYHDPEISPATFIPAIPAELVMTDQPLKPAMMGIALPAQLALAHTTLIICAGKMDFPLTP